MRFSLTLIVARFLAFIIKTLKLGAGSTWPGEIGLLLYPALLPTFRQRFSFKVILVAGTNGKTTTTKLIAQALPKDFLITNPSGANIANGIASALISHYKLLSSGKALAIFEVDEGALPEMVRMLRPELVIVLNLFRDQLDRYAELEMTAYKWHQALTSLPATSTLILNADDPLVASLGETSGAKVVYFGLDESLAPPPSYAEASFSALRAMEDRSEGKLFSVHSGDSLFCPKCGQRLNYAKVFYSHLGVWFCPGGDKTRPGPTYLCLSQKEKAGGNYSFVVKTSQGQVEVNLPLAGLYNASNVAAAVAVLREVKGYLDAKQDIRQAWEGFHPAFGRQEKIGPAVILLSKNPTGMNENLRLLADASKNPGPVMFVLNDGVADGRDVSWVYDVDSALITSAVKGRAVFVSGLRAEEMGLRILYAVDDLRFPLQIRSNLGSGLRDLLKEVKSGEVAYIIPTYTAMLQVRKELCGKKIL